MQDQGKRLLLAVGLALGVFLLWNMIFPPAKDDKAQTTGSGSNAGSSLAPPPIAKSKVGVAVDDQPAATGSAAGSNAGSATGSNAGSGSATGSNAGSGSATGSNAGSDAAPVAEAPVVAPRGPEHPIVLTYPNVVATFSNYNGALVGWKLTDPRYQNDATKGELIPHKPNAGAFQVNFAESTYVVPALAEWTASQPSADVVVYRYTSPQLDVTKTFTVHAADYMVAMTVEYAAKGAGKAHETLAVTSYGFQDPKDDGGGQSRSVQARVWASTTMRTDGTLHSTPPEELLNSARYEKNIRWTGFEHPYLLTAFAPRLLDDQDNVEKHTYPEDPRGLMRTDMLFVQSDKPTGSKEIVAYLGPKDYDKLTGVDKPAEFSTGFRAVVDLGWFSFIGQPLLWLLQKFYAFCGNWGLSIILLTFLVKLATLYWTTKSMRSMKAMAALAPKMKELQAKYADDKQRQQAETMALYKQHGVNPLAGCLPIVLQMPIWLALYRMLSSAGELYLQPFVPGWINDLTNVDPYHVLPVVLVITMFVQARLQPAAASSGQQKLMQYVMPLGFGVMSFFFPAGLTLYIFTNTLLSAFHSLYMNKYDKKSLASAALLKQEADKAAAAKATPIKAAPAPAKKPALALVKDNDDETDDADSDDPSAKVAGSGGDASRARPRRKKRRR